MTFAQFQNVLAVAAADGYFRDPEVASTPANLSPTKYQRQLFKDLVGFEPSEELGIMWWTCHSQPRVNINPPPALLELLATIEDQGIWD